MAVETGRRPFSGGWRLSPFRRRPPHRPSAPLLVASLLAIVLGVVTTANADVVVGAATSSSASAASLTFSHTVGSGSNRLLLVVCNVTGQGKGSTL